MVWWILLVFLSLLPSPAYSGTVYVCDGVIFANSAACAAYCGKACEAMDSSSPDQAVPCDTGSFRDFVYFPTTGKTYAITNSSMTWEEAEIFAKSRGIDLVMVRSEEENALIAKVFGTTAWIGVSLRGQCPLGDYTCTGQGASQVCTDGESQADCTFPTDYGYANPGRNYRYVDGSPLTFSAWAEGEPDYVQDSEFYVAVGGDGLWRDLGEEAHPAIVEFKGPLACVYPFSPPDNPPPIELPDCEAGEPCWACVKDKNNNEVLEEGEIAKCIKGEEGRLCPFDAVLCAEHVGEASCPLGDYPCENGQCTKPGTCQEVEQSDGYYCTITGENFETLQECQASCYREGSCTSVDQPVEVAGPSGWMSSGKVQVIGSGNCLIFKDLRKGRTYTFTVDGVTFSGSAIQTDSYGFMSYMALGDRIVFTAYDDDGDATNYTITVSGATVTGVIENCSSWFCFGGMFTSRGASLYACDGNAICNDFSWRYKLVFKRSGYQCSLTGKIYSTQEECRSACRRAGECQDRTSVGWHCDLNGQTYSSQTECQNACKKTARCIPGEVTYECPLGDYPCITNPKDGKKYCSDIFCSDTRDQGNYDEEEPPSFNDKENDGSVDDKGNCLGTIYIFNGKGWACRSVDYLGGIGIDDGCCNKDKVLFGLINCKEEEKMLARLRKDDLCHKVGSYCAKKFLGLCIKKYKVYCCFHSKLGRIIQEQGRPQLDIDWGDAKDPNCRGFTPDEFQKLDFSKMDFSEFFKDIRHRAVEEVRGDVVKSATQKIQQFYR